MIHSDSCFISSEQSIHTYGMWYLHTVYSNRHTLHRTTYTCNTAMYKVVSISTAIYFYYISKVVALFQYNADFPTCYCKCIEHQNIYFYF